MTTSKHAARHPPALHSNNTRHLLHSCCLLIGTRMLSLSWYHRNHWTNSWPTFVNRSLLMGCWRPFLLGQPSKPQTAMTQTGRISMFTFSCDNQLWFIHVRFIHSHIWSERVRERLSLASKVCLSSEVPLPTLGGSGWMSEWIYGFDWSHNCSVSATSMCLQCVSSLV